MDLPVHPVSTVGADETLLTRWFEHEVEPPLAAHRTLTEASLRRKIAHLQESVGAVLRTLLARQESGSPDDRALASTRPLRQYLDDADEVIRQTQLRCRDWTMEEPARLDIVVNDAAQAVVTSVGKPGTEDDLPVLSVLQRLPAQRAQMAQEVMTTLQRTLAGILESLRQSAPLAHADATSIRDLAFRGLPAHDLAPHREKLHLVRPWWASRFAQLAVWTTRRDLQRHLGLTLREQIELHDRQLQAWLKASVGGMADLVEAQAEVFREQARRLAGAPEDGRPPDDLEELRADLSALEKPALTGLAERRMASVVAPRQQNSSTV